MILQNEVGILDGKPEVDFSHTMHVIGIISVSVRHLRSKSHDQFLALKLWPCGHLMHATWYQNRITRPHIWVYQKLQIRCLHIFHCKCLITGAEHRLIMLT